MPFWRKTVKSDADTGWIFAWKTRQRVSLHVTMFLVVSVVMHGLGFYMFQVVYPTPVRAETKTETIGVLDPLNPAVRTALQRVFDRTVFLRSPSARSEIREKLDDHRIRFTPSFQSIGPRFRIPENENIDLESLFDVKKAGQEGEWIKPELSISPDLAERGIAPWSVLSDYLSIVAELPVFRIAFVVEPDGTVRDARVQSGLEPEIGNQVATLVESTLRFFPEEGAGSVEGWVEVKSSQ